MKISSSSETTQIVLASESSQAFVAAAELCGNGVLESGEECDDANTRDGDGCSATCLLEIGLCGDGIIQRLLGEQCEASLHDPNLPYACVQCRFSSDRCGDGVLDVGEECDNGLLNSTSPDADCRPDCSRARCGDGILDSVEECDDGNRLNGDGCDRFCIVEVVEESTTDDTRVAGDVPQPFQLPVGLPQTIGFPQFPTVPPLPYQMPLAQLQPFIQQQGPAGDTGPAAAAVIAAGAASGLAWVRRRRKK